MPRIFSFNEHSQGAKQISLALGWPRIVHNNSKFHGNFKPWVLNWGSEEMEPHVRACKVINTPEAVSQVTDKLNFFQLLFGTSLTPDFTDKQWIAQDWLEDETTIVARRLLKGHGGAGITIVTHPLRLPEAPLYVAYIKKKQEFRVHVFDGEIIDVQEKKRRREVPDDQVDWMVRNHDNGFIYARENVNPPEDVLRVAKEVWVHTDLDFGAVDVIWNEHHDRAYALEINSAPGLEGSTVDSYVSAIRKYISKSL